MPITHKDIQKRHNLLRGPQPDARRLLTARMEECGIELSARDHVALEEMSAQMVAQRRRLSNAKPPQTIQTYIALLVLLSVLCPSRAFAVNPDLEAVLTGSRQRIEKLDYRLTGRLTRVESNEKRTSYKFAAKAHWFPDGLRFLCEISGTGSEKTRILLKMSLNGHVTIERILPGEKAVSVLPFERWNDPVVGTDFSYEDLVESQFFWKNQKLLPSEKYGARDCFVLKSISGAQDQSHYDSVTSWIDHGILYPVHVVKTLHGTGQQKEFIYYGLRQVSGVWAASQIEAKVQGQPGSSILAIDAGSPKANLGRKDFDLSPSGAQEEGVK